MRITKIELAGATKKGQTLPEAFATIQRKVGDNQIIVEITQPTGSRTHHVQADCREDIWSMAECLQKTLDGCRGSNSMINDYFNELLRISNI